MNTQLTPQDDTAANDGPAAPDTILDHLHPDLLDLAYTALADALVQHLETRVAVENAEHANKARKAQMWHEVTAGCRNDAERDAAISRTFQEADLNVLRLRTIEMRARTEVELARIEVERNRALYTLAGISF